MKKIDELTLKNDKTNIYKKTFNIESEIVESLKIENNIFKDKISKWDNDINYLNSKIEYLSDDNKFLNEKKTELWDLIENKNKIIDNINNKFNTDFNMLLNKENKILDEESKYDKLVKDIVSVETQTLKNTNNRDISIQSTEFYNKEIESFHLMIKDLHIRLNNDKIKKYEAQSCLNKQIKELKIKIKSYELFISEIQSNGEYIKILK